ncbi:hypothetical protein ACFE04_019464 [Oxalis oulophora]
MSSSTIHFLPLSSPVRVCNRHRAFQHVACTVVDLKPRALHDRVWWRVRRLIGETSHHDIWDDGNGLLCQDAARMIVFQGTSLYIVDEKKHMSNIMLTTRINIVDAEQGRSSEMEKII